MLGLVVAVSLLAPLGARVGLASRHGPNVLAVSAAALLAPFVSAIFAPLLWVSVSRLRAAARAVTALIAGGLVLLPVLALEIVNFCGEDGSTIYVTRGEFVVVAVVALVAYLASSVCVLLAAPHVAVAWSGCVALALVLHHVLIAIRKPRVRPCE